jgi:DNA repair exonuclease SbcCD ATPase subunit
MEKALASSERQLSQLRQENSIRRQLNITQRQELVQKEIDRQKELADQRQELAARAAELAAQRQELADLRNFLEVRLTHKNEIIAARDMEIENWRQAVNAAHAERDAILNSTSWRLMTHLQRLRQRAIPVGSRSEAVLQAAWSRLRRLPAAIQRKPGAPDQPPPAASETPLPPGIEVITIAEAAASQAAAEDVYHAPRQDWRQRGERLFAGKRLLFVLPMAAAGGGANLVLLAARVMRSMGVDAQIYNLPPIAEILSAPILAWMCP